MTIEHFDNASDMAPAKFVPYYLLNGQKELIEMLQANGGGNHKSVSAWAAIPGSAACNSEKRFAPDLSSNRMDGFQRPRITSMGCPHRAVVL